MGGQVFYVYCTSIRSVYSVLPVYQSGLATGALLGGSGCLRGGGLGAAASTEAATRDSQMVRSTLERAGFVVHPVKSVWKLVQRLIWLGF